MPSAATVTRQTVGDGDLVVVTTRADLRNTVARYTTNESGIGTLVVCSEPSPDAVVMLDMNATQELLVGAITAQQTDAPGALEFSNILKVIESVTQLGERTQAMSVQREALHRLCEMSANGMLDEYRAWLVFDEILSTLRLVAITDLLRSPDLGVDDDVLIAFIEANTRRVESMPHLRLDGSLFSATGVEVCTLLGENRDRPATLGARLAELGREYGLLVELYRDQEAALVALLDSLCSA